MLPVILIVALFLLGRAVSVGMDIAEGYLHGESAG